MDGKENVEEQVRIETTPLSKMYNDGADLMKRTSANREETTYCRLEEEDPPARL